LNFVKNIDFNGIEYIDESRKIKYIDFRECNENWLNYRKRVDKLSEDKIIKLRERSKIVGKRDIDKNPYYIEFFTRPFTRFEFKDSKNEFRIIRDKIISFGWNTLDMS
jgi:hypothetical protein